MSDRSWMVTLDGAAHAIVLKHGYVSGRCEIFVDGSRILDRRPSGLEWFRSSLRVTEHAFTVAGHDCRIRIDPSIDIVTYRKQLIVDGRDVETGRAS